MVPITNVTATVYPNTAPNLPDGTAQNPQLGTGIPGIQAFVQELSGLAAATAAQEVYAQMGVILKRPALILINPGDASSFGSSAPNTGANYYVQITASTGSGIDVGKVYTVQGRMSSCDWGYQADHVAFYMEFLSYQLPPVPA